MLLEEKNVYFYSFILEIYFSTVLFFKLIHFLRNIMYIFKQKKKKHNILSSYKDFSLREILFLENYLSGRH